MILPLSRESQPLLLRCVGLILSLSPMGATIEDAATDGHISSEGAFLVNLFLDLLGTLSDQNTLLVLEDSGLFLVSPLGLWNKENNKEDAATDGHISSEGVFLVNLFLDLLGTLSDQNTLLVLEDSGLFLVSPLGCGTRRTTKRMRPRMDTFPVKGHSLSIDQNTLLVLEDSGLFLVSPLGCGTRRTTTQPHTFVVAGELFLDLLATLSDQNTLLVLEDSGLFLVSPLGLRNKENNKEDAATDGHISSEGAFLVNPHTFVVAGELLLDFLGTLSDLNTLLVLEDSGLFLISPLGLWNKENNKLKLG
ncbi:hypothetical protein F7725_003047 [Dissostichus mawsoni]|uniref:Uncharacterized protein n=1 Tax=Dissostichus mawsoni TaxID=36200 RepID=A0A7J5YB14_DISMA|nr:hypothetical protein F7725_003047 [Dissostichus mawsoni]